MAADLPYYFHSPGLLTRGAVLDVGLKCTHSCRFCYYSFLDGGDDQFRGMRRARLRTLPECKQILDELNKWGFRHVDITGGEPTLHPELVNLVRYGSQDLALAMRLITLGQFLTSRLPWTHGRTLLSELLEAGLTNMLLSVHAVRESLFARITGESFQRLLAAMDHLDGEGFDYTTNTTVFEWNYDHLPAIASELVRHRTYLHNFIVMNAYYEWNKDGRVYGIQSSFSQIEPHLRTAVAILEENGVACNIRYAPLCAFPGLEQHVVGVVGVRYDPYEWGNIAGHLGGNAEFCARPIPIVRGRPDPHERWRRVPPWSSGSQSPNGPRVFAQRGTRVFPDVCRSCGHIRCCDGVDPKYVQQFGVTELRPFAGPSSSAPLLIERTRYTPAFLVKLHPRAPMKDLVGNWHEFGPRNTAHPDVDSLKLHSPPPPNTNPWAPGVRKIRAILSRARARLIYAGQDIVNLALAILDPVLRLFSNRTPKHSEQDVPPRH